MNQGKFLWVLIPFLAVGCSKVNDLTPLGADASAEPDLVIENVDYTVLPPSYFPGYPSGGHVGGPTAEFTLTIRNAGSATLDSPFYISYSHTEWEFQNKLCSAAQPVNVSPDTRALPPGGSIDVKFEAFFMDSVSNVFFFINTNDSYDKGVPLPVIQELNYDNNSYVLNMNW